MAEKTGTDAEKPKKKTTKPKGSGTKGPKVVN